MTNNSKDKNNNNDNTSASDDIENNRGKSSCPTGVDNNNNNNHNKNNCQNSSNCQMEKRIKASPTGALNSSAALAVLKEAVKCVKDQSNHQLSLVPTSHRPPSALSLWTKRRAHQSLVYLEFHGATSSLRKNSDLWQKLLTCGGTQTWRRLFWWKQFSQPTSTGICMTPRAIKNNQPPGGGRNSVLTDY